MSFETQFERTEALIGRAAQEKLAASTVAVAGLGGVGGAVLVTLARLGIGGFRIADPGAFDLPDLNRQWAATHQTLGMNKTRAYWRYLKTINPDLRITTFEEGVTYDNAETFIGEADLLIEALDVDVDAALRIALADLAERRGIYNILPPILGFGAVVATAAPGGAPMNPIVDFLSSAKTDGALPAGLSKVLNAEYLAIMRDNMRRGVIPSLSLATQLVASLVGHDVLMILCRDEIPAFVAPVSLPHLTIVDVSLRSFSVVHLADLA